MRALVTGGAGFIGSHLVDALVARGDEVDVLDDLSHGPARERQPGWRGCTRASITDAAVGTSRRAADVVFHLAAQIDVRRSVADPAFDLAVNVGGTMNVLEAARRGVARRVRLHRRRDLRRDRRRPDARRPRPSARSRPTGRPSSPPRATCALLGELHGVEVTCLRFANVYGPRQDPLGEGGVCAIFCGAAVAGRGVTIFGDGEQTRDFVYVGDVVDACLRAARRRAVRPVQRRHGRRDDGQRARGRARRRGRRTRRRAPARSQRSCLDPSRAARELGWTPATDLATGLGARSPGPATRSTAATLALGAAVDARQPS